MSWLQICVVTDQRPAWLVVEAAPRLPGQRPTSRCLMNSLPQDRQNNPSCRVWRRWVAVSDAALLRLLVDGHVVVGSGWKWK